jgi:hypothetical protein
VVSIIFILLNYQRAGWLSSSLVMNWGKSRLYCKEVVHDITWLKIVSDPASIHEDKISFHTGHAFLNLRPGLVSFPYR